MHEKYAQEDCAKQISPEQYQQGYLRGGTAMSQDCAARQTAKGALRVKATQLRREADRLEALARSLPEELPPMADEALYDLIRAAA